MCAAPSPEARPRRAPPGAHQARRSPGPRARSAAPGSGRRGASAGARAGLTGRLGGGAHGEVSGPRPLGRWPALSALPAGRPASSLPARRAALPPPPGSAAEGTRTSRRGPGIPTMHSAPLVTSHSVPARPATPSAPPERPGLAPQPCGCARGGPPRSAAGTSVGPSVAARWPQGLALCPRAPRPDAGHRTQGPTPS